MAHYLCPQCNQINPIPEDTQLDNDTIFECQSCHGMLALLLMSSYQIECLNGYIDQAKAGRQAIEDPPQEPILLVEHTVH